MSGNVGTDIHLRMLIGQDEDWVAALDSEAATSLVDAVGFDPDKLGSELDHGEWATDAQWGWAVMVDGLPAGFALVEGLATGDGEMQIRLRESARGRGVGRETLRQLADHHFADSTTLLTLVGRTHERNVAMQRAFNAAGFRLASREPGVRTDRDGDPVAEWSYALTREEWNENRHRRDAELDVHGLEFTVIEVLDGPTGGGPGMTFTFWQQGRRVWGEFGSKKINGGDLGGVLVRDTLHYRFVQDHHRRGIGLESVMGTGRARFQRDTEGRLQVINEWQGDDGSSGATLLGQADRHLP